MVKSGKEQWVSVRNIRLRTNVSIEKMGTLTFMVTLMQTVPVTFCQKKSISSHVFQFDTSAVSWNPKRQSVVALSSTEAEYIALSHAAQEVMESGI